MSSIPTSLTALTLQKFKKNFWGVLSLSFIVLCGLLSLFAYILAPDSSRNANQMHLSIHSRAPGFTAQILTIPSEDFVEQSLMSRLFFGRIESSSEIPITQYEIIDDKIVYLPFVGEGLTGISKELIIEGDMDAFISKNIGTKTFLLGTDRYGRDLLSRMLVGARISFTIGFIAVFISLIVGLFMGSLAGYFGGKVDALIMWFINVTWSIPTLLLVIAITLALGKGYWQVFIAVGLTMWVEVARVVRGQIMGVKKLQYVTAARAMGYSDFRIITKHILPNVFGPLIVICAANFASAILIESGLSFLGIGAQPPTPSWGGMIKDHYSYIILGKPFLAVVPGLAIMLLVMAFMLMGNALRDALDVKI